MWENQTKIEFFAFLVLTRLNDISIQSLPCLLFYFHKPTRGSLHLKNLRFTTPELFYSLSEPLKTPPPYPLLFQPQALFQHLPVFSQLTIIYLLLLPHGPHELKNCVQQNAFIRLTVMNSLDYTQNQKANQNSFISRDN